DKAYLIKFINLTIKIQNARQDKLHPNNSTFPPKWTLDTNGDCEDIECTYYNSLLIYPMAKFVNMVVNDPDLYNTNLPIQQYIGQDIINMYDLQQIPPYIGIIGYGDFARWLGYK